MWVLLDDTDSTAKMVVFHDDIRNHYSQIGYRYKIIETDGFVKHGNSIEFIGVEYEQFIPCTFMDNDCFENVSTLTIDMDKFIKEKAKTDILTSIINDKKNNIKLRFYNKKSFFTRKEKRYCDVKLNGLILYPKRRVDIETNNYFIEERK